MLFYSSYDVSRVPHVGNEQKLSRIQSDYLEPATYIPDKEKADPIYENPESSAQQSKDVTASVVKMEDNPAYDTSMF